MAVTMRELSAYVGKTGWIYYPRTPMAVSVKVIDVRTRFGTVDVEVEPLEGMGSTWVTLDAVKFDS